MYWNSTFLTDNPRCQSLRGAVALRSGQFICNSFWNAQITKPPMGPMAQTPKESVQGCVSKYCNYWQEPQKGNVACACSCLLFGLLLYESREIFHTVWSCTPLAAWISESQTLASTTFKLARLSRLLCDCHHTYYGPWNDQLINYNGGIHTVAVSTHRTETPFFICLGTLKGGSKGRTPEQCWRRLVKNSPPPKVELFQSKQKSLRGSWHFENLPLLALSSLLALASFKH